VTIDAAAFSLLNNCFTSTPFGMWWSAKTAVEVKANNEVINARKIFMMMCPCLMNKKRDENDNNIIIDWRERDRQSF
jgi:hypothetical protein